jgi:hypothetical protein
VPIAFGAHAAISIVITSSAVAAQSARAWRLQGQGLPTGDRPYSTLSPTSSERRRAPAKPTRNSSRSRMPAISVPPTIESRFISAVVSAAARWLTVGAGDTAQGLADRGMPGIQGLLGDPVRPRNRGHPAAQCRERIAAPGIGQIRADDLRRRLFDRSCDHGTPEQRFLSSRGHRALNQWGPARRRDLWAQAGPRPEARIPARPPVSAASTPAPDTLSNLRRRMRCMVDLPVRSLAH